MTKIVEQQLTFSFAGDWIAIKYDEWAFYRQKEGFQGTYPGVKAVDILAIEPPALTTWLIEVKDYRQHTRRKSTDLLDEVTQKVLNSLAGMVAAQYRAKPPEKQQAQQALQTRKLKIVLHLEQPAHPHRHNLTQYDISKLQQKLRKRLNAIDPTAKVRSKKYPPKHWHVT